jgi:hypothetical protein
MRPPFYFSEDKAGIGPRRLSTSSSLALLDLGRLGIKHLLRPKGHSFLTPLEVLAHSQRESNAYKYFSAGGVQLEKSRALLIHNDEKFELQRLFGL